MQKDIKAFARRPAVFDHPRSQALDRPELTGGGSGTSSSLLRLLNQHSRPQPQPGHTSAPAAPRKSLEPASTTAPSVQQGHGAGRIISSNGTVDASRKEPPLRHMNSSSLSSRTEFDGGTDGGGPLVVLGGSSRRAAAKRAGLDLRQLRDLRPRGGDERRFNHWDDGAGSWDCDTLGLEGADDCGLRWEGVGTTNVGPRM